MAGEEEAPPGVSTGDPPAVELPGAVSPTTVDTNGSAAVPVEPQSAADPVGPKEVPTPEAGCPTKADGADVATIDVPSTVPAVQNNGSAGLAVPTANTGTTSSRCDRQSRPISSKWAESRGGEFHISWSDEVVEGGQLAEVKEVESYKEFNGMDYDDEEGGSCACTIL